MKIYESVDKAWKYFDFRGLIKADKSKIKRLEKGGFVSFKGFGGFSGFLGGF